MSGVQIFVEGVADQKFLQDVIQEWFGQKLTLGNSKTAGHILEMGGKDAFDSDEKGKAFEPIFSTNTISGIKNVVIFDADNFAESRQKLTSLSQKLNFDFFLFPNDVADGDLETLLTAIINTENKAILDCWQEYEKCLNQKDNPQRKGQKFTTPASKTKIYAYLEALLGESKTQKKQIKEINRDYRNAQHWILDTKKAPMLAPLKQFLEPYFSTK